MKWIFNPYIHKKVLVSCGKCDACRQEKACARANRIRNNVSDGTIALFITLTYSNDYVPFIYRDDLLTSDIDINIYRNCTCRRCYSNSRGTFFKKEDGISIIDTTFIPFEERSSFEVRKMKSLKGLSSEKIGVCYYKDLQDFFKRLRQNLSREYGYKEQFSFFACSEYGGFTQRPHFHGLLFIQRNVEQIFRDCIVKSWPYADNSRTAKFIEVARDAASYVAAYVNGNSNLPSLLENTFKQKHSSSKHFGVVLDCFTLPKILEKVRQSDLHYYSRKQYDGTTNVSPHVIPAYVINRYFPILKGFRRFTASALFDVLLSPERIGDYGEREQYFPIFNEESSFLVYNKTRTNLDIPLYHFTPKETYSMFVRLENAYQYYFNQTGKSRYDYAIDYMSTWRLYHSTVIRDSLEKVDSLEDFEQYYENVLEFGDDINLVAPTLANLDLNVNPNTLVDIVMKSNNLTSLYSRMSKQKKVTNYVMNELNYNV